MLFSAGADFADGQMQYPKTQEFDEDSCDAFSPEQPGSQELHGSVPSPGEAKAMEVSSPLQNNLILVILNSRFEWNMKYCEDIIICDYQIIRIIM